MPIDRKRASYHHAVDVTYRRVHGTLSCGALHVLGNELRARASGKSAYPPEAFADSLLNRGDDDVRSAVEGAVARALSA